MGNTLDKPQAILNRAFNKKTSKENHHLDTGNEYDQVVERVHQIRNNNMPRVVRRERIADRHVDTTINQFNTTLAHNGLVLDNITPDATGKVQFSLEEFKKQSLSTIIVFVSDNNTCFYKMINMQNDQDVKPPRKDLTLKSCKDGSKVYQVSRFVHKVLKSESKSIKDFANTEYSLLSDVGGLYDTLHLLGKTRSEDSEKCSF